MFIVLKVILKVPFRIVLRVVSGSENGPLSDSGVRFANGGGLLLSCPRPSSDPKYRKSWSKIGDINSQNEALDELVQLKD